MFTIFRSPSGKSHLIDPSVDYHTIECDKPRDTAGQWIVYSTSNAIRLIGGIRNGKPLERLGESLVFSSSLDEAGEEFIAVLRSRNLLLVRLSLTTQKLALSDYYQLLEQYQKLLGVPPFGAASVGGMESDGGRPPFPDERSFRLVRAAFELLRKCRAVRPDLPKHPRGHVGKAGIDAYRTLAAWKRHRSWYRVSESSVKNAVCCGRDMFVEPLRTVPRPSVGGNVFLGATIITISELLSMLPRTTGGRMAAGLLQAGKRALASMDVVAPVGSSEARELMRGNKLPHRSEELVDLLRKVREIAQDDWNIEIAQSGVVPYCLPETELVFQRVAVAALLYALGTPIESVGTAYSDATRQMGFEMNGQYVAWADTPSHGLDGWREESSQPSGYRPDLVIRRNSDSCWLLVDAKLRQGDSQGGLLSQSGIKDLQAYMHEFRLRNGVLLVPGSDQYNFQFEDVEGDGYRIRAISVPSRTLVENATEILPMIEGMWNSCPHGRRQPRDRSL